MSTFTQAQRDDLATLLAATMTLGGIESLASSVLGRDARKDAPNTVSDIKQFARAMVSSMEAGGALGAAVNQLRTDAQPNSRLTLGLNRIIQGKPLAGDAGWQKFVDETEPFLRAGAVDVVSKGLRVMCAIGLDVPGGGIEGTGFLIGPDLVLTNYHVLERVLKVENAVVTQNTDGKNIYCLFDYTLEPAPAIPPALLIPSVVAQGAAKWLEFASLALIGDGTDASDPYVDQHDFAVIRLSHAIGELPARAGGGDQRGWLTLDEGDLNIIDPGRIFVFQHPQRLPQMWDVGPFERPDPTKSRVWYWVNTAHGSSGGAAVDSRGRLYAIHNAAVNKADAPQRQGQALNQGVRSDLVRKDLKAGNPNCLVASAGQGALPVWALSDDMRNAVPVIGRSAFRKYVHDIQSKKGPRALRVTGAVGSGVRFSTRLLKRILGPQVPVAYFRSDTMKLGPDEFARALLAQYGIFDFEKPVPPQHPTEDVPRWIRGSLLPWLLEVITSDKVQALGRFPAWTIVDCVLETSQRPDIGDKLPEFIAALAGSRDPARPGVDIPQLRWLFLMRSPHEFPLGNTPLFDEDLGQDVDYGGAFLQATVSAQRALKRQPGILQPEQMAQLAEDHLELHPGKPTRQVLGAYVQHMMKPLIKAAGG